MHPCSLHVSCSAGLFSAPVTFILCTHKYTFTHEAVIVIQLQFTFPAGVYQIIVQCFTFHTKSHTTAAERDKDKAGQTDSRDGLRRRAHHPNITVSWLYQTVRKESKSLHDYYSITKTTKRRLCSLNVQRNKSQRNIAFIYPSMWLGKSSRFPVQQHLQYMKGSFCCMGANLQPWFKTLMWS